MRSVVQSDQLQTAWGPRPWPIDNITALRAETKRFVDQCDTEDITDHGGLVQATEMLEELAWTLLTCRRAQAFAMVPNKARYVHRMSRATRAGLKNLRRGSGPKRGSFQGSRAHLDSSCDGRGGQRMSILPMGISAHWAGAFVYEGQLAYVGNFELSNTPSANGLTEYSRRWRVLLRLSAGN